MNVKQYQEFLNEGIATARRKYLDNNKISQDEFNELKLIDPSKTKKYLNKLIQFYLEGISIKELKSLINIYHELVEKNKIQRKDINSFKTSSEFMIFLKDNNLKKVNTEHLKDKYKALIKLGDVKVVFEKNGIIVFNVFSEKASNILGAHTKWCISATKSENYFKRYQQQFINFYFIFNINLNKNDILYKIAFVVYQNKKIEIYNVLDNKIKFSVASNSWKDIIPKSLFKPLDTSNLDPKKFLKTFTNDSYKINNDGSIDINGNINLNRINLKKIPFRFNKVSGNFSCINNYLTSLKGAPKEVGGNFNCSYNNLTTLEGAPEKIGGDFDCSVNQLISLKGAPKEVKGEFQCYSNKLLTLEGAPKKVEGNFDCSNNKLISLKGIFKKIKKDFDCSDNNLKTLEGAPKEIGSNFYCFGNNLTTFEGVPKEIGRDFNCNDNQLTSLKKAPKIIKGNFSCGENKLKTLKGAPEIIKNSFYCGNNQLISLEGAPKEVGNNFWCNDNQLTSLEGSPKEVGGNFDCSHNKVRFKKEDVKAVCRVNGEIKIF